MSWLHFCILTIILYTIHDVILKAVSDEVSPTMASLLINASAAISLMVAMFFIYKSTNLSEKNTLQFPNQKLMLLLIIAGIALGSATITFMKSFSNGGAFSLVLPMVYVGIIVISVAVGIFWFKEKISLSQLIGILFSITGIYLMLKDN